MKSEATELAESGPPIEDGGPFSGRLNRIVAHVPRPLRTVLGEAGGMTSLFCQVAHSAIRHPRGYWGDVIDEINRTVRRSWLAIIIALGGFLIALSVPSVQFVSLAGVGEYYGPLLFVQSTRTFTVWVSALLVAGVVGTAMTAELGARKVREELDAMQVMGIDPIRTLVVPRMVAVTIFTILLSVPATIVSLLASQFTVWYIGGIEGPAFYQYVFQSLSTVGLGG